MTIARDALHRTNFDGVAERDRLAPVQPGEILRAEFMAPLGLSARALARDLDVPPNRITEIVKGERSITAETAILLAHRFGTSARFWMNLQVSRDLAIAERNMEHAT
jgi:addiction module HigA family antidote